MAIENFDNTTVDVQTLKPFKKFIMSIGELPTNYIDSLSYAELLTWFCDFLQNKVIPTINNNAEAIIELQNYINNLDLQEEVNNKLDEMAEDGTLESLVKPYFDTYIQPQIDEQNINISNITETINQIIQYVNNLINNNPIPVSDINDMTDTTKVYLLTTDGYWYYYNGTNWVQGGLYQSTSLDNNSVHINNLDTKLSNIYDLKNFKTLNNITYETGYYYNNSGNKIALSSLSCTQLNVTEGDILLFNGYGVDNARAYSFINSNNNVVYLAPSGTYLNEIIKIPNGVTKVNINWWNNKDIPRIAKIDKYYLNNDAINKIINKNKTVYGSGSPYQNGMHYFKLINFLVPLTDIAYDIGDVINFSYDIITKSSNKLQGSAIFLQQETGTVTTTYAFPTPINEIENINHYNVSLKIPSNISTSAFRFLLSPDFIDRGNYDYLIQNVIITNLNKNTSIDVTDSIYSNAELTNMSLSEYFNSNYLKSIQNRKIICAGDSLTAYDETSQNSYVDFVAQYYNDCEVLNYGSRGAYSSRMVNYLTNMARDNETLYPIKNPDYSNCSAVILNIGVNGGITGNYNTSVPQIENAKDLNGNSINYLNVTDVINNGIIYNNNIITSVEDYWNLFNNDWYGNVSLIIEYIQWKNPYTQIFLLAPCIYNTIASNHASAEYVSEAMKFLCEKYGIEFIDINNSIGINRRNNELYRYDNIHGTAQRNTMVGKYVSKYISNKIYQ